MSEFAQIVSHISEIVKWTINQTINIICAAFYILACILPYRVVEISYTTKNFNHWRENACPQFVLTLFDFVCLPLGLMSLSSPWRWPSVREIIKSYDIKSGKFQRGFRSHMFCNFFMAAFDLLSFPFFVVGCLSPMRFTANKKEIIRLVYLPKPHSELGGHLKLNFHWFVSAMITIFDIISLFIGLLSLLSPLRCHATLTRTYDHKWDEDFFDAKSEPFSLNFFWISQGMYAILDVLCFFLFFLSLASPLRLYHSLSLTYSTICNNWTDVSQGTKLNDLWLLMGVLSLCDYVTLPFLIISIITPTRTYPVCHDCYSLLDASSIYESIELNTIWVTHGIGAFFDVLFLVPGIFFVLINPCVWTMYFSGVSDLIQWTIYRKFNTQMYTLRTLNSVPSALNSSSSSVTESSAGNFECESINLASTANPSAPYDVIKDDNGNGNENMDNRMGTTKGRLGTEG